MKLDGVQFGAWAALAVLSVSCAAFADDRPKPRSFEDKYYFESGVPNDYAGHTTHLAGIADGKRSQAVARGATTNPSYLRIGRRLGRNFLVCYPDLAVDDVAPFFGAIYRVDAVACGKKPMMRVIRVPADKLPKGVSPAWDSLAVPLARDGRGMVQLHDGQVRVEAIKAPAKEGEKPTARISVSYRVEGMQAFAVAEATVKEGDVVLLPAIGHKVRAVVPADAKTRLIGWVEFAPDPIAEAELVKKKIDFVRPKPRKK
jgi:hypothetical protein